MASKSTTTINIAPDMTSFEVAASQRTGNTIASFVVYTTLVTSLGSPTQTALPSNVTATTPPHAAGPVVISPDDIPQGWIPDMQRGDTIRFHTELIFAFGVLGIGIAAIWLWSLCGWVYLIFSGMIGKPLMARRLPPYGIAYGSTDAGGAASVSGTATREPAGACGRS